MTQTNKAIEYAKKYVELGWSIIPIKSTGEKKPACLWKEYQTRKATIEEVETWVRQGHYLAVVTGEISGIVVVDDDRVKKGLDEYGFDSPLTAKTQNGGKHFYFKCDRYIQSHCNTQIHVDLKADRSYVLLPPFNNREWLGDPTESIDKITPLPNEIEILIRSDKKKPEKYSSLDLRDFVDIPQGERTSKLYKLACSTFNKLDFDSGKRLLYGANQTFDPPLDQNEFDYNVTRAWEYVQKSKQDKGKQYHRTDTGNAELFTEMYGDKVRFDHRRNRWLVWDRHRWIDDKNKTIKFLAMEMAKTRYIDAANIVDSGERTAEAKWAIQSESKMKIDATLDLSKSIKPIADNGSNWDTDSMVLSCPNGIVDLDTGKLREGEPEDRITMCTNVEFDPTASCPRWEQFVNEVFEGNSELIHYVHKALGYSISGSTKEQSAFFCFGSGSNGKSVLFKTISQVLGDYAHNAPASLFQRNSQATNTNDVAATECKRFLVSSETLSTSKLNEQRLKKWTGGDTESARFLYGEYFEFEPTVKPWLFINHKPQVEDDSYGFWRRVRLIPFNRIFRPEEQDLDLLSKLKAESKGILRWLVDGCNLWIKEGLNPTPEIVKMATQIYQAENDVLAEFIDTDCVLLESVMTKANSLYNGYTKWADKEGIKEGERVSRNAFGRRLGDRFTKKVKNSGAFYLGIALKTAEGTLDSGGLMVKSEPEWWINHQFTNTSLEDNNYEAFSKTIQNPPHPPLLSSEDTTVDNMAIEEIANIFQQ